MCEEADVRDGSDACTFVTFPVMSAPGLGRNTTSGARTRTRKSGKYRFTGAWLEAIVNAPTHITTPPNSGLCFILRRRGGAPKAWF